MAETEGGVRYEPAVRRPRSAETRARLLRSALALFRERGYHGAGTNEIGAAAGMTGPSIYRHFATKDALLVAAVLEGADQLGAGAAAALHETNPARAVELLCTSFVEVALDDPDLLCVYFYESRHLPDDARDALDVSANRYLAHYQRFMAQLRPELSAEEIHIRVMTALHMVGGMCTDLPSMATDELTTMLTRRMLATLLADVEFVSAT